MSYNKDYMTKESMLSELRELHSAIIGECYSVEDLSNYLAQSEIESLLDKIILSMSNNCASDIEEQFSTLIEESKNSQIADIYVFDSTMGEIIDSIEKLDFFSHNQIIDGIYISDVINFHISTMPGANASTYKLKKKDQLPEDDTSDKTKMALEESIDAKYVPLWLNTNTAKRYIFEQTRNNKLAWSSLSTVMDASLSVAVINATLSLNITQSSSSDHMVYFAPFEAQDYADYYKLITGSELNISIDEKNTRRILIIASLLTEDNRRLCSLVSQEYTEEATLNTFYITHYIDDMSFQDDVVNNFKLFGNITNESKDKETIKLSCRKYTSFIALLEYFFAVSKTSAEFADFKNLFSQFIPKYKQRLSMLQLLDMSYNFVDTLESTDSKQPIESDKQDGDNRLSLDTPIEDLDMSIRTTKCLKRADIETLGDMIKLTEEDYICVRNLGKKSTEEAIMKVRECGYEIKIISEEVRLINELALPADWEKKRRFLGIHTLEELSSLSLAELHQDYKLPNSLCFRVLTKLDTLGFRLSDCPKDKYSSIDIYIKEHYKCIDCGSELNGSAEDTLKRLCKDCGIRSKRLEQVKKFSVDIKGHEYTSYVGGENGFTVFININSKVAKPLKLRLGECCVFSNGRQYTSSYNLNGYAFSEDYIFPSNKKTFAKIWITDKWEYKKLSSPDDYLTLTFIDTSDNTTYYFKFVLLDDNSAEWRFFDYYEIRS